MIVTRQTSSFQETENSPTENMSGGVLSATRTFRGPSRDRFKFVQDLTGGSQIVGAEIHIYPIMAYPDNPGMLVTSWSIRNTGRPVDQVTGLPVSDLNEPVVMECNNLESEIVVNYSEPNNGGTGGNSPGAPAGTLITVDESWSIGSERQEAHGSGPKEGFAPVEEKTEHREIEFSQHEIKFNWTGVVAPNFNLITEYTGKLNNSDFWWYPRSAVRFDGAQVTSSRNVFGQWVYNIAFTFTARTDSADGYTGDSSYIKNGRVGIWNRFWHPVGFEGFRWVSWDKKSVDELGAGKTFYDMIRYVPSYSVTVH